MKLDPNEIKRLPIPEKGQRDYPDGRGLNLRIFDNGRRTWVLRYRNRQGIQRKKTLGDFPQMSLAQARKESEDLRSDIRAGADPAEERRQERAATRGRDDSGNTLGDLIDLYLTQHAARELSPTSQREYKRVLTGDDIQKLRAIPAAEVTDFDVANWLDTIEARRSPTMVNRAQSYLSAVYTWAAPRRRMGVISNPVRGLPRRHREHTGEKRWLHDDELAAVFGKVRCAPWADSALRLIVLTGQRPGEVLQMRWEHVDLDGALWSMPAGYRKGVGRRKSMPAHDVPLAPQVVEILKAIEGRRGYVFAGDTGSGFKETQQLNRAIKRRILSDVEIPAFTPHDLRRTASTHLHRAGTPRHVVEKTLGHIDGSVAGVYDRHAYTEERRAALADWADRLEALSQRSAASE